MTTIKKLYQLLTISQRKAGVLQFLLMLVGMLFETLGIGLLIPVLSLISQEDFTSKYPMLKTILYKLGSPSQEKIVIGIMILLVLIYFLKMLFLSLLAWKQSKFIYGVQSYFSQRLFNGYLHQPYTFHLERNSSELIRNATVVVSSMTSSLTAFLMILTEFFTSFGIFIFLFYIEPIGTLFVVGIFGFLAFMFQYLTKNRLLAWGNSFQFHEEKRILHLQQGLGGAKDVKLLGREDDFINQYSIHNLGSARSGQRKETIQAFPRLWLELLAVTCMAILVSLLVLQGKEFSKILPILGIFAAAAFRLMPSVSRIMGAFQNVRYAQPALEALSHELSLINAYEAPAKNVKKIPFLYNITLQQVYFKYQSSQTDALAGVSISIEKGTAVGFIGTSGAGKSTLVDILLGLLTPSRGSVRIDGIDIQNDIRGWQNHVGYVPQSIFLTDDTLRRNIALGLPEDQINDHAIWRAIKSAQLEQFINELPLGVDTVVGERGVRLSGGQRQRIGIARALYHNPEVLVLDEATSSLDSFTENGVMEAVRALKGNKTIIIVAHRLSTVESCDYLYRLEKGKITEEGKTMAVLGIS